MKPKALKILATLAVLVLALTAMMFTTLREGAEYYKRVDEVMVNPDIWHGKPLQLHGYVERLEKKRNSLEYRFMVKNNGSVVQARYTGVVPDTFKDGSEVVLKGKLSPDGFHVDRGGVMAKCPSKYEEAKTLRPNTSGS
jgi:cytochrome c-type biogenesis protein CcmE